MNRRVKLELFRQFKVTHAVGIRSIRVSLLVIVIGLCLCALRILINQYYETTISFVQHWVPTTVSLVLNLLLLSLKHS